MLPGPKGGFVARPRVFCCCFIFCFNVSFVWLIFFLFFLNDLYYMFYFFCVFLMGFWMCLLFLLDGFCRMSLWVLFEVLNLVPQCLWQEKLRLFAEVCFGGISFNFKVDH